MKTLSNWLIALACFSAITVTSTAQAEMQLEPGTSVVFRHHDLLGSPIMVSDHKGRTIWYENTAPYGKQLGKQSSGGVGHLDNLVGEAVSESGYTGHTVDNTTGLVYMKARHYDPVIGRFYSNDPVGTRFSNVGSFNRYQYALNNPYYYTDPTGRSEETIALTTFLSFVAADMATPDPTDAGMIAKAPAYAAAAVGLTIGTGVNLGINWIFSESSKTDEEENTDDTATEDAKEERKDRKRGETFKNSDDPQQQLEEISRAQDNYRKGKTETKIDNIEKSQQRAKHDLDRVDLENLDQYD